MLDMLNSDLAYRLALAVGGVVVALGIFVAVLAFLKRRNSPLFIKGGRAREPRLMVLDAAAIDPKRRLVLVRRDDVEHLIMIGGPTDIVIETGIFDRAHASEPAKPAVATVATPSATERARSAPAAAVSETVANPRPVASPAQPAVTPPVSTPATATAAAPVAAPVARVEATPAAAIATPSTPPVSSMGNLLYSDDREPLSGTGLPAGQPDRRQPSPLANTTNPPLTAAAESVLDQARTRVLSAQPATTPVLSPEDAARALAAKLDAAKAEAARREAIRRQQAAATVNPATAASPVVAAPVQANPAPSVETTPSDFEKLLEAELEAGGLLRGDGSAPAVTIGDRPVPDTRQRPDVTAERDMARRLGEMSLDRKS